MSLLHCSLQAERGKTEGEKMRKRVRLLHCTGHDSYGSDFTGLGVGEEMARGGRGGGRRGERKQEAALVLFSSEKRQSWLAAHADDKRVPPTESDTLRLLRPVVKEILGRLLIEGNAARGRRCHRRRATCACRGKNWASPSGKDQGRKVGRRREGETWGQPSLRGWNKSALQKE